MDKEYIIKQKIQSIFIINYRCLMLFIMIFIGLFFDCNSKSPANMIVYDLTNKEELKLQTYICKNCDDLICETSVCPVCGKRAELLKTEIFYCEHCKVPTYDEKCPECGNKCIKIGTDVRPVFAKERLLLEVLLNEPFKFANHSVWCVGANNYVIDGNKMKMPFADFRKKDPQEIISELKKHEQRNQTYIDSDFDNIYIKNFIKCNANHLNIITDEAIDYIRQTASKYDISSMFVSFSGGKDSTATSSLVMRALGTDSVPHIYGDTTLEYPESGKYIEAFKKKYPKTPILVAKNNDQDFRDLCDVVGPPSRVMRWCCTIFKTGAITKKIEQLYKNKVRLLSFQGVRRAESASRSKYDRDTDSPKISKQQVASPIIDWTDFDVWLYILSNQIPFNGAYREGFARVGCWCCPNNSDWSAFLSSVYMNEEFNAFKDTLYRFAKKVGKEDWKEYIDTGKWKARQGGNGLEHSKNAVVTFKPCTFDESSINFSLSKAINKDLYTLFKPFGFINYEIGNKRLNEVYVLSKFTNEPIIRLSGKEGSTELKVTFLKITKPFNNQKEMADCVRNQITKFQTCIGCSYCQSVCKFNALKVINKEKGHVSNNTIEYTIDETKCVGCLECVKHFDGGCYMKKVLRTKKGE